MQQDDEDRKNEVIIKGLEDKVKELEDSLKEKEKNDMFSRRASCRSANSEQKVKRRPVKRSSTFEGKLYSIRIRKRSSESKT
jgi:Mg2+ and Co2+ transporter CorA